MGRPLKKINILRKVYFETVNPEKDKIIDECIYKLKCLPKVEVGLNG